jgi:hypothetical protein
MDDKIYNELEVMFSYHGHPLSWYEFAESKHPKKHKIAVGAMMKKADAELKQALLAAAREHYDKKQKCVDLEKVERENEMDVFNIITKVPAYGMLG